MPINRSSLTRSPAIVTWNGATFFTRDDIAVRHLAEYLDVMTSMYGRIDRAKKDLIIKIPLNLWSAWENLSLLFPGSALNPGNGASLYGTSDVPLVIQAKNNDRITYANAQLTKLADLHLGVDGELFSASVEFTALLANNANPEDAGSCFTIDTNTYADGAFAKTNFKKGRASAAWGSVTGFTAIVPQKGFNVAWEYELKPVVVDGLGTVDMTVDNFAAAARCIPIQPTLAQLKTNSSALKPRTARPLSGNVGGSHHHRERPERGT